MASIHTPEYPPFENSTPLLPLSERTLACVWETISSWPYWGEIQRVAHKEYGMSQESFEALLPEYQRFLTLILLGYQAVGMFSGQIDKIWHSHILSTHLYLNFCLSLHGHFINHVPQVPCEHGGQEDESICKKCQSCVNCSIRCKKCEAAADSSPVLVATTAREFVNAYMTVFNVRPPAVWDLDVAEECAAD